MSIIILNNITYSTPYSIYIFISNIYIFFISFIYVLLIE